MANSRKWIGVMTTDNTGNEAPLKFKDGNLSLSELETCILNEAQELVISLQLLLESGFSNRSAMESALKQFNNSVKYCIKKGTEKWIGKKVFVPDSNEEMTVFAQKEMGRDIKLLGETKFGKVVSVIVTENGQTERV